MTDWLLHLIDGGGYWGIGFLMVLENVFPPIPSELIMGIGGIRVSQGRMEMLPLLLSGTIGTTIGNYVWFLLGWKLGFARLKPFVDRYGRWATIDWSHMEALNRLFARYGQAIVFFIRFTPTFRTMISLPAGLFRMGHIRFLLWTAAGAGIWNTMLAYGGYFLGKQITQIEQYLGPITTACVVLVLIFYVYRVVTWKPRREGGE